MELIRILAGRWKGNSLVMMVARLSLTSAVYHLWMERNRRLHRSGYTRPEALASVIIDEVREKLATLRKLQDSEAHRSIQARWELSLDIFS